MAFQSTSLFPHWLTLEDAAGYLKISKPTLYRWISEQRLRAYSLPTGRGLRLKGEDLDELLAQPRLSLSQLQPRMAEFGMFNDGNAEFQEIAVMVRNASTEQAEWPRQVVERSLAKAEASNPAHTYRGRLIRQARLALIEWMDERNRRLS
jgi:excisionase family DNA binding protein